MRIRELLTLAVLAGVLVAVPAAGQAVAACAVVAYPGDDAPKPAIAAWMASGASARGVPGELPVMAALVESGLANLRSGDADAQGYFQMRESIWSRDYPGFQANPELQLDWFLDQAAKVRTPPYPTEEAWGEWAADVERPAAQNRGKYQLRLAEARALIGTACSVAATDTTAPVAEVSAPARQKAIRRHGVKVPVSCPAEACTVEVRALVKLGGRPELAAQVADLAAGQVTTFRLKLRGAVRRLAERRLDRRRPVRVVVTVTTTDQAGNAASSTSQVRVTG